MRAISRNNLERCTQPSIFCNQIFRNGNSNYTAMLNRQFTRGIMIRGNCCQNNTFQQLNSIAKFRYSISSLPSAQRRLSSSPFPLYAFAYHSRHMSSSSSSSSNESSKKKGKSKKVSKKQSSTNESGGASATEANPPPENPFGQSQPVPTAKKTSAVSTFVVIKEKTEETFSFIYIIGVLFVCFPYTLYLVGRSLFSSSGADKIRNETFSLVREDPRVMRALGGDLIARQNAHSATFIDDDGNERLQVIYELGGSKGDGRVDVEMLKEGGDWRMQYCIVTTQYASIPVVDNRSRQFAR